MTGTGRYEIRLLDELYKQTGVYKHMMKPDEVPAYCQTLRAQGLSYPTIAEQLAKSGYTSPRTKRPLTAMTVRHLVTELERTDNRDMKEQSAKFSGTPVLEKLEAVKKILQIKEIGVKKQMSIIQILLE